MKSKLLILFLSAGFLFLNSCDEEETSSVDLTSTITASDLTPVIGTNVTFTIVAHNNGPDNATGVDVTSNLPTGYKVLTATTTTGTVEPRAWTIGSLANGKSETLTIVATVLPTGFYPYSVTILGFETDPSTLNNISSVLMVPEPAPVAKITYTNNIKPLLVASCTPCHVAGGSHPKKWDEYATTKTGITGIINRVTREKGSSGFMPKGGEKLSDANIALLNQWVTDGTLEN